MTKDERGVWSATVGPLKPELWFYRFVVNGVPTVDPQNNNVIRDANYRPRVGALSDSTSRATLAPARSDYSRETPR